MELVGSTRGRILALVKEQGRSHPDDIAAQLGMATTSVRQHLSSLERDGYVRPHEVREGTGRPRRLYTVTRHGDATFPKRYDLLAANLLRYASDRRDSDVVGQLVEGEVARLKGRVNGLDTRTRMEEVAQAMRDDGGMARVMEDSGGLTIVEPNCVYSCVAATDRTICEAHVQIIERLLAVPVSFVRTSDPFLGGCRWRAGRQDGLQPGEDAP
jgi:predicted ArsR family transcriptional regulator